MRKSTSRFWRNELVSLTKTWKSFGTLAWKEQPTFGNPAIDFPAKWHLKNKRRTSILMTRHYPDLGIASDWLKQIFHVARPIRSTTQIWVVTRHQYGISALVSQTSLRGKPVVASWIVGCFLRLVEHVRQCNICTLSSLPQTRKRITETEHRRISFAVLRMYNALC